MYIVHSPCLQLILLSDHCRFYETWRRTRGFGNPLNGQAAHTVQQKTSLSKKRGTHLPYNLYGVCPAGCWCCLPMGSPIIKPQASSFLWPRATRWFSQCLLLTQPSYAWKTQYPHHAVAWQPIMVLEGGENGKNGSHCLVASSLRQSADASGTGLLLQLSSWKNGLMMPMLCLLLSSSSFMDPMYIRASSGDPRKQIKKNSSTMHR